MEFEQYGLPPPVHCEGKPFKVSHNHFILFILQRVTFYFCLFFKSSLAPTLVFTPVFIFHLTSFNCDSKEAWNIGLTFKCHLSNIMPDSTFNDRG